MNRRTLRLIALCIFGILLCTSCQSKPPTLMSGTGGEDAAPTLVTLARDSVLEYLLSSSRLPTCPTDTDWQLDTSKGSEKEFHFQNGDWRIVIWLADEDHENQRVVIINKVDKASWTGYITPKGHVVDTAYGR